jgi:hypothetical protein
LGLRIHPQALQEAGMNEERDQPRLNLKKIAKVVRSFIVALASAILISLCVTDYWASGLMFGPEDPDLSYVYMPLDVTLTARIVVFGVLFGVLFIIFFLSEMSRDEHLAE